MSSPRGPGRQGGGPGRRPEKAQKGPQKAQQGPQKAQQGPQKAQKTPKKSSARVVREQLARERRRRRTLWTSLVAVAVLVIAGLIGWAAFAGQDSTSKFTAPAGATADGNAIAVGTGPVTVDIYEDFICPFCGQFEKSTGSTLDQLVSENKVRVLYHPVAYLDRASSTEYSTRSSAASGCAANQGKFREYVEALFNRQPAEGSAGLSDQELIDIGTGVGLDGGTFGSCVRDGTFKSWTAHVTEEASRANINSTPTVLVNGKGVDPNPDALKAAVAAATK
ncbi:DsbA family protein [Micromonospora sp. NPDC050397]|uniref:DsbA family protein n=1 Tax=Micromonospora sp. NPDC050397 TaxID=3364279 RepID=UPI00384F2FD4